MARVHGPMMSLAATGTLASTLTFQHAARGPVARMRPVPSLPKTVTPLGNRPMMSGLSKLWRTLTAAHQATWIPLAQELQLPAYHAFMRYNGRRLCTKRGCTQEYPAAETGNTCFAGLISISPKYRTAKILDWGIGPPGNTWGTIFYLGPTGFTPNHNNIINIPSTTWAGGWFFLSDPITPGTYQIAVSHFSTTGKLWYDNYTRANLTINP